MRMRDYRKFYINGEWVDPVAPHLLDVINPATEKPAGRISLGGAADVDRAVAAARAAFPAWADVTREARVALLGRIIEEYNKRVSDIAAAITEEMGAPAWLANAAQAPIGNGHLGVALEALKTYPFEEVRGHSRVIKEPIGVVALITPWNWPINQICAKVVPALATGNTVVLKPSEIAPFSAYLFTQVIEAAGIPAGVFNLVNGDGPTVGAALAAHPGVDMISFTGSTRAGIEVARNAASTVKRVVQELGGKSANIVLADADLPSAIGGGVFSVMMNSGQSCAAPTRMLAPNSLMPQVLEIAKGAAEALTVGDPTGNAQIGPVVSEAQWNRVQGYIQKGIAEGATLLTGGLGKPEGLETGYFVKPTIFADVTNDMTIAREEIFGPVLCIIGYDTEDEAIKIANDTEYGLAGGVQSANLDHANAVARRIRAGYIQINNAGFDVAVPFGGYKRSGNGREFGDYAFDEYLEVKSIVGSLPSDGAKAH
jgi:aldehyde dehydrogenase (NAD+)